MLLNYNYLVTWTSWNRVQVVIYVGPITYRSSCEAGSRSFGAGTAEAHGESVLISISADRFKKATWMRFRKRSRVEIFGNFLQLFDVFFVYCSKSISKLYHLYLDNRNVHTQMILNPRFAHEKKICMKHSQKYSHVGWGSSKGNVFRKQKRYQLQS